MATPFFVPLPFAWLNHKVKEKMADSRQNVFIVTLYSFFPLDRRLKCEYERLMRRAKAVEPERLIRYTAASYCVEELKDEGGDFYYEYSVGESVIKRKVQMKVWLYKFTSVINPIGRYYLVTTISIDKVFGENDEKPQFPFGLQDICTSQDIAQLKKAAYGGEDSGLYYKDGNKRRFLHYYLNRLIKTVTGHDPMGRYGRHYLVDICGVDISQNLRIESRDHLTRLFSEEYYSDTTRSFDEVVKEYRKLVYGLFFGNENNEVIPDDTLQKALRSSFSNNRSERLFAYHKTIVFLHTHHPYPYEPSKAGKQKKLREDVQNNNLVWDVFLVMEARLKLKSIEHILCLGQPQNIKDALASISGYLATNPYRLGEYGQRSKMLYLNMGINEKLRSVKEQGNLLADAKEIDNNEKLNRRVYSLTAITVVVGVMTLIVSILCCNTCDDDLKTVSDMYSSVPVSADCLGSCCAVVGVLLGLVLAASVIVMAVYQVKSFYKLKDIEDIIKQYVCIK